MQRHSWLFLLAVNAGKPRPGRSRCRRRKCRKPAVPPELVAGELSDVVSIYGRTRQPTPSSHTVVAGTSDTGATKPAPRRGGTAVPRVGAGGQTRVLGSGLSSSIQRDHRHPKGHVVGGDHGNPCSSFRTIRCCRQRLAQADQIDTGAAQGHVASPPARVRLRQRRAAGADPGARVGSPLGFGGTGTQGIVSALNRD